MLDHKLVMLASEVPVDPDVRDTRDDCDDETAECSNLVRGESEIDGARTTRANLPSQYS